MIEIMSLLGLMGQLSLLVIVIGTICGGAVGVVASELAAWWHNISRDGEVHR